MCGSSPTSPIPLGPQNSIGDADTGSTDFAVSLDGTKVVFIADYETAGVKDVWVVDLLATPMTAVAVSPPGWTTSNDATDLKISPDGSRVAFRADGEANSQYDMYVADITMPVVPRNGRLISPGTQSSGDVASNDYEFSSDSRRLAFLGDLIIDGQDELFISDISTSTFTAGVRVSPPLVAGNTNADVQDGFIWTVDGAAVIFFAEVDALNDYDLFWVDASNPAPGPALSVTPTTAGSLQADGFGLANDGSFLWYIGNYRDGATQEVYVLDLTASSSTSVGTAVPAHPPLSNPALSAQDALLEPGGTRLLVRGDMETADVFELFLIDLAAVPSTPVKVNAPFVTSGDVGHGLHGLSVVARRQLDLVRGGPGRGRS